MLEGASDGYALSSVSFFGAEKLLKGGVCGFREGFVSGGSW